jgi:hypothetical protein
LRLFILSAGLILALTLASCGGSSSSQPKSPDAIVRTTGPQSSNSVTQPPAVTVSNFNRPKLKVDGNGGKCSLSTGSSFHFTGSGFTPGGKVMLLVFAPPIYKDPTYKNPYRFYWFQANFGVLRADSRGEVHTKPWDCRYGPANTQDPQGTYEVKSLDWRSGVASRSVSFSDVP